MIIIGEKINGAIPSIKQAIENHDEKLIRERVAAQVAAGADYIDCAPSTAPEIITIGLAHLHVELWMNVRPECVLIKEGF